MLKILHLADLHLDSRFVGLSASESANQRKKLRSVVKNAFEYAKNEDCPFILISGDLFDGEYYTADTIAFLSECFKAMPEHKFIIAPGNHDPISRTSPYRFESFPENVFIFDSEELSRFDFGSYGLNVYGYAFTSDYYGSDPLSSLSPISHSESFNVLCAHTELDVYRSPYAPISTTSLAVSGFDYAALGHIHKGSEIKKAGNTVYAYSGCIAGRDFTESGKKGGIVVTLDKADGKKTVSCEKVVFCPWVYETLDVNIDDLLTEDQIFGAITEAINERNESDASEHFFRINLKGQTAAAINTQSLEGRLKALGVAKVKDETFFLHSALELAQDYSLKGEFYRALLPMLNSIDEAERKNAEKALEYGLIALSSGEIII